jgi:asparagine N-glycosylation enzyme membrane subunit Stt3
VTNGIVEIVSIFFSFLALAWAILFFWKDRKTAGFALLVAFILSFSAVLNQRIVFSGGLIGLTVERYGK